MPMETLTRQVEFRAEGRRIVGVALPYNSRSESHNEIFEPGSIEFAESVPLNLRHRQLETVAYFPDGGLALQDSDDALTIEAVLPPIPAADVALRDIRDGKLRGLSIEFSAKSERRNEHGVRVVEKATLVGLGLVSDPSYQTTVEARRGGGYGRGRVMPANIRACSCVGPDCDQVDYKPGAFDQVIKLSQSGERNVTAVAGRDKVLASTAAGSLTLLYNDDGGMEVELGPEVWNTPAGRDLADGAAATMPVVRPLANHDDELTVFEDSGRVRTYSSVGLDRILINPAPHPDGWIPIEIQNPPRRRRWKSWL